MDEFDKKLIAYVNQFWNKTETGDSKWSGEYPHRFYQYEAVFEYRQQYFSAHTVGSNAGFKWTTIPMKDCFRVDLTFVFQDPHNNQPWVRAETKLKKKPKRMAWPSEWAEELLEGNRSPNYEAIPYQNFTPYLCFNFGWMYRTYLNYFFLTNSIGQYDTVKGIKVTWDVPKDDEVWKHPDDGKEDEEVEKPPDDGKEDEEVEKPPPEKPVEATDPTPSANSLIPFITTIEIEITKIIDELKKCLEQKRKLQEKKSKLCKDYNKALEDTLNASNRKYETLINSAKRQKDEEVACLTVLCESIGSKKKPEVNPQDKDEEIKKKIEAVKEKCKVVFG